MIKKFSALLIVTIMIFSLAGCASGGYQISVFDDGRILESFYIELNQSAIELAGYDYSEVETEVLDAFDTVTENLKTNFMTRDDGLSIFEKTQILQDLRNPSVENNVVGVSFLFDEYADYKTFYDIEDTDPLEEPDNVLIENKTFFIQKTTYSYTVFKDAQDTEEESIVTALLDYFSDPANGDIAFSFGDVNFTHSYATSSTKLRSNADRVYYSGTLKVHEWNVPAYNYNLPIEFYEYTIISTWWYIVALGSTTLFILGLLVAHNIDRRKKKKEQEKVVI
jgi:hypothetical protein